MALIFRGQTECSICNEVLNEGEDIVMTSHFIADSADPLWRFSDSGMHRNCFLEWAHKQEFIKRFNDIEGSITWGNGTYHHMEDNGSISVLKRDNSI
jgi:hypothetical protein